MILNTEQQSAVEHLDGPCIVTAVPGSGKTKTLTSRVINLIKEHQVEPRRILCLTFTNKAAEEMKNRVASSLGEAISDNVWISTFHSLCLAILRRHSSLVGLDSNFTIYDEKDQKELIAKVARMQGCEDYKNWELKEIARVTNNCREDLESIETHLNSLSDIHRSIAKEYISLLDEFNAVDFSGILYKCWLLLSKNKEISDNLSSRFKYLLIDEGQDTNTIQYEIVKKIASHNNVFVVADYQQSIFSWRNARPENLLLFKKDFEDVKEITLPRNYRSTSSILEAAERLIHHNSNARNVILHSVRGKGHEVVVKDFPSPEMESIFTVRNIEAIKSKILCKWSDFAVLYRTNQQSKLVEMQLRRLQIPYRIVGGFSFFDRKEIKTALAYLSFLNNPMDTISFARAISTPRRGVGETSVGRIERLCQQQKTSVLDVCENTEKIPGLGKKSWEKLSEFLSIVERYRRRLNEFPEIVYSFLKETGYYDHITEVSVYDPDSRKRIDNLDELLLSISNFTKARSKSTTLSDYLQSIKILSDDRLDDDDAVTLLTMHSAKGLEFPIVSIIGVEKDIVPHKMAVRDRGEEEERRLLYVGVTRARDLLILSYCTLRKQFFKNRSSSKPTSPSPYIEEMFPPVKSYNIR